MKSKIAMFNLNSKSTFSATLLALILGLIVLWTGLAAVAAEKKYVTDPTTGKVVSAPEYGGTLTYARTATEGAQSDVWYIGPGPASKYIGLVNEMLAIGDWGIDRDVWDWLLYGDIPLSFFKGNLAESWETPDDTTMILHIRQGVHWHDKPPMNGRELTAKDVEYNFHRFLGMGKFSEAGPSPHASYMLPGDYESITATDDWTVVFKLEKPLLPALPSIIAQWGFFINPPEVIEQHGDYKDWRNTVGTGPYELTDVVEGSSITRTKNPNYWGFDEKYPQNRLPYADKITALIMPEEATRLAALRSGKVDMLATVGDTQLRSLDQVESLRETDPEIVIIPFKVRSDNGFVYLGTDRPPFNDIRVRQAMQMALDLETINDTYFKGYGDPTPQGDIANDVPGIGTPFEEWPEEVKKTYRYDPEGAEALLDAAGYKRGADGIRFKTLMAYHERYDASYAELAAGYWRAIGLEIGVDSMPWPEVNKGPDDDTYKMSYWSAAMRYMLGRNLRSIWYTDQPWTGSSSNRTGHSDPEFDALIDAADAATTIEEQFSILKEANMWVIEKQLRVWGPETPQFQATQPWVKGYNGELKIADHHTVLARLWIDSELKEAMGH